MYIKINTIAALSWNSFKISKNESGIRMNGMKQTFDPTGGEIEYKMFEKCNFSNFLLAQKSERSVVHCAIHLHCMKLIS